MCEAWRGRATIFDWEESRRARESRHGCFDEGHRISKLMKNQVVYVNSVKDPVKPSPGFAKKRLSTYKLDIMALCGFGCRYCSSNAGNYLRINRRPFAEETERQIGQRLLPAQEPSLTFEWPDVIVNLERQLERRRQAWGRGETLVFSMLTDGFSPRLVKAGTTRKILEMILERTSFRIRVLTKNAIVGSPQWLEFFAAHQDRFVVGLSIGTLSDDWARRIEVGTSLPSARLRALRKLQESGIPTYGMLCPIFPDVMEGGSLERLVDCISPHEVEHIWAEPYNDRVNWATVREGYDEETAGYRWFTETVDMRLSGIDPSIIRELSGIYKPFVKAFKELVSNA